VLVEGVLVTSGRDRSDTSRDGRGPVQLHASVLERVFDCEPQTPIPKDSSYIISYPHILGYFGQREVFDAADLVRGAHLAYGWMPTVLELHPGPPNITLDAGAHLLTRAKRDGGLNDAEIEDLASLINNSLVGASKLLHFVAPENFAIWDSRIYAFIFRQEPYPYRVKSVALYQEYLEALAKIRANGKFERFHASVNEKVGYPVSAFRAIELIMFLNSGTQGERSQG